MRILLTVLIPTSALAASYGIALGTRWSTWGCALALAILLILCGFFIIIKRK